MIIQLLLRSQFVCNSTELAFSKVFKTTLKKKICTLKIMDLVLHFLKFVSRQLPEQLNDGTLFHVLY